MNRLPLLFAGLFLTFAFAWFGLVFMPYVQVGRLSPATNEDTGALLPQAPSGLATAGRQVYVANGCVYCHTQQVRPAHQGYDLERGYGKRATVARDFIHDRPVLLGTMRTGPDLANVGIRGMTANWHHIHLYDPKAVTKDSIMAPYRYLYIKRPIRDGKPSPDALVPEGNFKIEEGYEIIPTDEAKALVAYLLSLDRSYPLPEAPVK